MRLAADSISIVMREWQLMGHYYYATFQVRASIL